ncbi:choline O-acetyltransferase-like isoform X2 [Megalobrama amblycephala]|uniref:choline O-acetyltransferase-like isoform X2 n=1 Tax=Megalobrama amblycephala TaxID=75352 RepID=UPI002013E761|nr:choline O-acetyltransferase-like isoform X2 [Megalobrama amblycephala]
MMPVLKREAAEDRSDCSMLPKVPVPDLQLTLDAYLRCVQHLVSETQLRRTKAVVETFGKPGGVGEKLQKQLLEKREKTENWVYDIWLEDMYLKNRLALPVNSSPALVFLKQSFRDIKDSFVFAARLILGVSQYKTMVDGETLLADVARGQKADTPLCMDQYKRLFSSYRRAGPELDSLITVDGSSDSGHVIVACKNQFFMLNLTEGSCRLNEADVQAQLQWIYEQTLSAGQKQPAVGLLTSDGRTDWAAARDQLLKDPVNRESVELMERCVCVVCLDDPTGLEPSDANRAVLMLHGGGPDKNGANRWYDKPLQFVVGADGVCGVVCEHSPFEGIVLVQCTEHVLKHIRSSSCKPSSGRSTSELPHPRRLMWKCSARIQSALASAADHLRRLGRNLDMSVFTFAAHGKELIKHQKMSPDAYIQLALQLAFYRCHRRPVSTYESASLRRFRQGRVDNIRSATPEALAFAKAMTDGRTPTQDTEKMEKLRAAIEAQTQITALAVAGMGIDNHLLGLRETAKEMKMETPDIFSDETYHICNHFILSTSQVPTTEEMFCCYGPVVPNGYGVCYNPQPDRILFCVSSFRESKETCSGLFVRALDEGLQDMMRLCRKHTDHSNRAK